MNVLQGFMDKKAVAQVLEQIAAFLELQNENPFRIRAFRTAARAVGGFPGDLREGLGKLANSGVGQVQGKWRRSSRVAPLRRSSR